MAQKQINFCKDTEGGVLFVRDRATWTIVAYSNEITTANCVDVEERLEFAQFVDIFYTS